MPRKKEVVQQGETESLALALRDLCEEKGLSQDVVIDAMSEALKKAYFKYSGDYPDTIVKVDVDLETGAIKMAKIKNVVAEISDDVFETDPEEAYEETGIHYQVGDVIETPIDTNNFKRAAALQAKSVFKQKLREAEKQVIVNQYSDKVGDIISGIVDTVDDNHCIVKIGHISAYLSKANTLPNETLKKGSPIKVYVEEVAKHSSGTPIIVSRTNPRLVTRLMEQDIQEISDGLVEIKGISRMPGVRSKVAVASKDPNIDPSGSCIGPRGSRIARVLTQLSGEKIDVVNYNENPLLYVADALKPAQVIGIQLLDQDSKACRAIVPDDQYSLAIGKEAQNVNLAVRLTSWKIDIKSLSDAENAGYTYQVIEDLKFMEQAKKRSQTRVSATPVVDPSFSVFKEEVMDEVEVEDVIINTPVEEITEVAEQVQATPAYTAPIKEKEVSTPRPTKSKTPNLFSELEAALNASTTVQEPAPVKKKWVKKTDVDMVDEEETPKLDAGKKERALPIYTEAELKALEEEEKKAKEVEFDEDVDYDEFDEYYDK